MSFEYYNKNSKSFFDDTVNLSMEDHYKLFLPQVTDSGRILDVGCGSGRDTKMFLDRGYQVIALDASQKMVELASNYSGVQVIQSDFKEINWINHFDGIWACASLLHISKSVFLDVGEKLYSALKTGAPIYMSFKYGDHCIEKDGRLFQCYNERNLKNILSQVGFDGQQDIWVTSDVRVNREDEKWLNAIIIK